jgi:hypothetical protein
VAASSIAEADGLFVEETDSSSSSTTAADVPPPPSPAFLISNLGSRGLAVDALNRSLLGHTAYNALLLQQQHRNHHQQGTCVHLCQTVSTSSSLPIAHLLSASRRSVSGPLLARCKTVTSFAGVWSRL